MEKPKKLIRTSMQYTELKESEIEEIEDQNELNALYVLKIQEELAEIQNSDHKDITEFADLFEVVIGFAKVNGFGALELNEAATEKYKAKGGFNKKALNNLNPNNPSNSIYFK